MSKPRTITEARKEGYIVKNTLVSNYSNKVRIDMQPRFFNSGKYVILSYWITQRGAKRLGIWVW